MAQVNDRNFKVDFLTWPYREYNEDSFLMLYQTLFVVFDGATGLCDKHVEPSDAAYLVSKLRTMMYNDFGEDKLNLENLLEKMNEYSKQIYEEFIKEGGTINQPYEAPSCGITMIYLAKDKIYAFTTGDTMAYIKLKNKNEMFRDKRLLKFDADALTKISRNPEQKLEILQQNRNKMNTKDGYDVFTISENPSFKWMQKTYEYKDVKEIYLCTDGYYQGYETFHLAESEDKWFNKETDVDTKYDQICEVADSDPDLKKYPRFKKIDDITVIKILFEDED